MADNGGRVRILTSDIDGFHPSNEGHRQIAEAFLEVILPAFRLD